MLSFSANLFDSNFQHEIDFSTIDSVENATANVTDPQGSSAVGEYGPEDLAPMRQELNGQIDAGTSVHDSSSNVEAISRSNRTNMVAQLSSLDRLLLRLKQNPSQLPWASIASVVEDCTGQRYSIPALHMRYQRLRKRTSGSQWNRIQVDMLNQALAPWESRKWEIVASKMVDLGMQIQMTAKDCKWMWLNVQLEQLNDPQESKNAKNSAGSGEL